jgi:FkbM family methyltransferase
MMTGIEELPNKQWVLAGDTHISKWSREWGTIKCDPALFAIMTPWLKDVSVVWDIGACIGDHTRFYLDIGKTVVAVEPNPLAFQCLAHNCPEAILLNSAASAASGTLRFITDENAGASRVFHEGPIEVPSVRMDDLDLPPPGFVKIDAEGWEYDVIAGMTNTLRANLPLMFIEINAGALSANGHSTQKVFDLLKEIGYTKFQIHQHEVRGWDEPMFDAIVSR